jgi:ATP-binding cassette subfamily B protein
VAAELHSRVPSDGSSVSLTTMSSSISDQLRSWRQRIQSLSNLKPILVIGWRTGPSLVMTDLGLRLLSAFLPFGILWVARLIIDAVVKASNHVPVEPQRMWTLLGAEFFLAIAGNLIWRAIDYYDVRLADQFTREISLRIMDHASHLDLQSFEDPGFYDKLERARAQATDRIALLKGLGQFLQQAVTFATLSAAVIAYSPWLLVLMVLCILPSFLGESHFAFRGYDLAHSLTPVKREMDYLRVLGSSKESAKELKIFGLGGYLRKRFDRLSRELIRKNRALARTRLGWCFGFGTIGSIGYYVAYSVLVFRALRGDIKVADLTFLAGALMGCTSQIQALFSTFSNIADQTVYLGDLLEFFAVKPRIRSRAYALPAPRAIRDGFEFRNVSFHYPGSSRLILDHLNLRVEAGERIALVGENGQGKTTLVKLISRLYDPTSGAIFLDGADLRDYKLEELHREIGVIFQDFMRYDFPARENIGVGRIDLIHDDGALWKAARRSRADEVIAKLPREFDQMLGRRFEGGVDLSGGEWQRFAIARAYLREAQVLILDEPTSALDAAAELEVFERFAELTRGRTVLLISHRFSTVRIADRIIVLEGGRIREQGTHGQLIEQGGRYADLFEMQASNYR